MTPHEKIAAVYAKLHENRYEHIEQARRARDMQAMLEMSQANLYKSQDNLAHMVQMLVKFIGLK